LRVLVISDIHGNYDALKAVLNHAKRYDYVWVLGDLVDYGPEPHLVVDAIKNLKPDVIIRGNHDHANAFNADCGSAKELHDISVYTREYISRKYLSREQVMWLRDLPIKVELELGGKSFYIVHASPLNPLHGYLRLTSISRERLIEMLRDHESGKLISSDVVVVGHTHIYINEYLEGLGVKILNPGSVGQPRDGNPMPSYIILDLDRNIVENYRVKYEVEKVILKLKELIKRKDYLEKLIKLLLLGSI